MAEKIRIATFNVENLDDVPGQTPNLNDRIKVMRPQLERIDADILCLQEVHGQETQGEARRLLALDDLIQDTPYSAYFRASTMKADGSEVYDKRNLVILSRFEIIEFSQFKHEYVPAPKYQKVMANPPEEEKAISWERPALYAKIKLPGNRMIHILNLHLKSKIPSSVEGQKINNYKWKSAAGWAEGFFISSMKRVGQALEVRVKVDQLFDQDENALIVVCGDLNTESDQVPVQAIRGEVENTGNEKLSTRVLIPCQNSIPESSRYTLIHQGKAEMIDHLLISRNLLAHYRGAQIHNEILHDESIAFATDKKYPESDHAPLVAEFEI